MIRPWGKAICPCPSTFHSDSIRNRLEDPVILVHIDEMLERPGPNSTEKNRFTINCGLGQYLSGNEVRMIFLTRNYSITSTIYSVASITHLVVSKRQHLAGFRALA